MASSPIDFFHVKHSDSESLKMDVYLALFFVWALFVKHKLCSYVLDCR